MSNAVARPLHARATARHTWTARLARFATAGQTVAQFCAAEGVSAPSFYLWKRRLAATPPTATDPLPFLPVQVVAAPAVLEFVLPGGTVLRVRPDTEPTTLVPWLRLLGILPC